MTNKQEWLDEPNKLEWEYEGYECVIIRNSIYGYLCGYVCLDIGHPWALKYSEDATIRSIDVHGGITFSDNFLPIKPYKTNVNVWWIGFAAGHTKDFCPFNNIFDTTIINATYKNMAFIKAEVEKLARQCKEAANNKRIDDIALRSEDGEHILVPKVIPDPKELQDLHDIANDLHMQEWVSKKGRDVVKTMQAKMEEIFTYLVAYGLKSKKITIKELGRYIDLYRVMEGVSKMQRRAYFIAAWEHYTELRHRCEIYCEGIVISTTKEIKNER